MTQDTESMKAYAVGINHVALEVGSIDEALEFYGNFLNFEVHDKNETEAFIYFGDQFINITRNDDRQPIHKQPTFFLSTLELSQIPSILAF